MFSKVLSLSCVGGTLDSGWGQIFSFYKEAGGAGGAEGAPWPSHGHSTHRRKEVQTPWGPGVTWRREAVVPGPKGHTLRWMCGGVGVGGRGWGGGPSESASFRSLHFHVPSS